MVEIENVPSENPHTGRLSYLSAIAMLRKLGAAVQVGSSLTASPPPRILRYRRHERCGVEEGHGI